jgi:protein-S-isoprenylcysteine O-methyltransferase Ste14
MSDLRFRLGQIVQLTAAVVLLLIIVLYSGPWNALRVIGLIIALPSVVLLFIARFQLGRSFAVTPQAKALVTHGVYSKIRNPIYTFAFFVILGLLLALQRPFLYPLLAVLLVIQILRARQEAKVLEEKFGDQYREYRKRTWF